MTSHVSGQFGESKQLSSSCYRTSKNPTFHSCFDRRGHYFPPVPAILESGMVKHTGYINVVVVASIVKDDFDIRHCMTLSTKTKSPNVCTANSLRLCEKYLLKFEEMSCGSR